MSDFNDKNDTFVFKPEREEKPQVERTEHDEYSSARRVRYREEEDEERTSPLVYVAIGLAIVLVITIIIGVLVLSSGGNKNNDGEIPPENPAEVVDDENIPEDEVEEEEKITITEYGLIFSPERIFLLESGDGYGISADLYNNKNKKVKTEIIRITDETDIRDNGNRISVDAFIFIVENQGGSLIKFESEVREEDNTALSITYDSRGFEDEVEEEIPEKIPEEVPSEDETEGNEGFVEEPVEKDSEEASTAVE